MESFLAQRLAAVRYRAGRGAGGEDSVNTCRAHFVVAFWVDQELKGGVKVTVAFADGAYIGGGVVEERGFRETRHHAVLRQEGVQTWRGIRVEM